MLKQCLLNLAPELYMTKETKWHLLCHCHDNTYATGPVLINSGNRTEWSLIQSVIIWVIKKSDDRKALGSDLLIKTMTKFKKQTNHRLSAEQF